MKKLIVLAATAFFISYLPGQILRQNVINEGANDINFFYQWEPPSSFILPPLPWLNEEEKKRVGWAYFWMFSDGIFYQDSFVQRGNWGSSTTGNINLEVAGKLRGKYTPPDDPRLKRANISANTSIPSRTPPHSMFPSTSTEECMIVPEWRGARLGDSVFLALVVKNRNQDLIRSGDITIWFPREVFQYKDEIFTSPRVAPFNEPSGGMDVASDPRLPGRIMTWHFGALQPQEEKALFICLEVTDIARYDSSSYDILLDLDWDPVVTPVTGGGTIINPDAIQVTPKKIINLFGSTRESSGSQENPLVFEQDAETTISVNFARDPNTLTVLPNVIPPSRNAPSYNFTYTVTVENVGTADVGNLTIVADFEQEMGKPNQLTAFDLNFKKNTALGSGCRKEPQPDNFYNRGNWIVDTSYFWCWSCIMMGPSMLNGRAISLDDRSGSYRFNTFSKSNIVLNEGDSISATALIKMKNDNICEYDLTQPRPDNQNFIEDIVRTGKANIYIRKPERMPYGLLFGLKWHQDLSDSSITNRGLNLTLMYPLINPRGNSIFDPYIRHTPNWFLQFELGYGRSEFNTPNDLGRYRFDYIHITPAMVRYVQPVRIGNFRTHAGLSLGYSTGIIYKATLRGINVGMPSNFSKRLEHELVASIDLLNMVRVPGLSIGLGYKLRTNNFGNQSVQNSYPFWYAQFNFMHLTRRHVRLMNRIYPR